MEKFYNLGIDKKKEIRENIKKILINIKEISFAYIFGSFNKNYSFKDIDIASYSLIKKKDVFEFELQNSLNIEKEIKIPIDFKVLNFSPIGFQITVIQEGDLLFEKDRNLRLNYIENLGKIYMDYFEFSKKYLKELVECIKM